MTHRILYPNDNAKKCTSILKHVGLLIRRSLMVKKVKDAFGIDLEYKRPLAIHGIGGWKPVSVLSLDNYILSLYSWNICWMWHKTTVQQGTIKTKIFVWLLSNFRCKLFIVRGRILAQRSRSSWVIFVLPRSIATHRDHFVRRLSVGLCVCLSGSHAFLVVTHRYVSKTTHAFLGMLPLCFVSPNKHSGP